MLASFDGTGFLTSDEKKHRDLGSLLVEKAVKEPTTLSSADITNLLVGAQLLIMCGPASCCDVATIALEGIGSVGCTARYADLEDWSATEDGRTSAAMLDAVAKVLEYRLVKHSHELEKREYEDAFIAGFGWTVCIPLAQGQSLSRSLR